MTISEQQITSLFIAYFNRAPAKNGYDGWVKDLDDGVKTYEEVSAGFIAAPEFKDTYGEVDVANDASLTTFVTAVYKNVLGRDGSEEGIAHQVAAIKAGGLYNGDLAKFMAGFTASAIKPFDPTDPKWDNLTDEQKAAADTASDKINNKMLAADYFADTLAEKTFINGAETPEAAAKAKEAALKILSAIDGTPESLAQAKALIDDAAKDPATAIGTILDADLDGGSKFVLKPSVDTLILTDANDTITGESSTIGADDTIIDTSIKDNDVMNIALTGDMTAATITNVENINVTLNTLGGTKVDASNISGANITVGSTQFGFSGQAEIDNLGKNDATAGENISELTVTGITKGTIDTGSATTINATVKEATDSIALKVHGDVALKATTNYKNLSIDADKDAVVNIAADAGDITDGKGDITGEGNVTLKTDVASITGEEITNSGTGELTVELTDSADVDLKKVATDKVITDDTFANKITYGNGALDITAKKASNDMKVEATAQDTSGGSIPNSVTIHLEAKAVAAADKYNTTNVTDLTIDAQKGGTIDKINDTNKDANVTLIAGDDLTVTDLDAQDHAVIIDAASKGDIELTAVQASIINATLFTQDLKVTQSDDENIAVVGAKGKNTIETIATDKTVSIVTQDADDIVTIANTTGQATVKVAGGKDTVNALALEGKATIELGEGDNTLNIKGGADTADATVTAGAGVDTMTVSAGSDGKISADLGAGNDIADLTAGVAATANITLTMGAGDDVVKAKGAGAETITFDGGAGTDSIEVVADSDFSDATITFTDIENLKIDTKATFDGDQLSGQTFKISATGDDDQLIVEVDSIANSDKTTDLSTITFDNTMPTGVEYVQIDATAGLGNDTIKGASGVVNHIMLGAANGKDTIQLSADSMGLKMVETDAVTNGIKTADLQAWTPATKADYNLAVVENFETADDSIVLGGAASASNYRDHQIQVERDDNAAGKDLKAVFDAAIAAANDEMDAHADVEYVYVYNTGKAADNTKPGADSFLLWDTDGDHDVDAAILLVGINAQDAFDHTDIVAG